MNMNFSVWRTYILFLLFVPEILSSRNFSSIKSFEDAVNTLEEVCKTPPTCEGDFDPLKPTCCGDCMCTENCFESGTCCLRMYDNFTHVRLMAQNRRSSCLLSRYLPYKHTDFPSFSAYVFVTTCNRESTNDDDIYMCETSESEIETVVPVTEPVTNVHYKNKYCAYCNNIDKNMQLISWKLQIYSSQYISLPRTDLLEVIRRTRSNIIFIPPGYVDVDECFTNPDYTIRTCNQTGLWQKYDELIETACEFYTDAFNLTYKNFFCFLCNADTSAIDKDWDCLKRLSNNPAFSIVYDLNVIMKGHTTHKLVCNDSQFLDEHMVVCRDIFCDEMHILFNGKCDPLQTKAINKTCFSVFMKLTSLPALPGTNFATRDQLSFFSRQHFYKKFSQIAQQVKLFFKTNGTGYIDYFVAYIVSIFSLPPHLDEFLEYVVLMSKRELHLGEDVWKFSVELARYDMTVSDQSTKLLVHNLFENSFDELTENFTSSNENICSDKETVQLSKLNKCPHIRLRFGELPMKIALDFLLFLDYFDNKIIKMLSKWEYKMQGETIKICFKDYLIISNVISRSRSNRYSSAEILFLNRVYLLVFISFSIHKL